MHRGEKFSAKRLDLFARCVRLSWLLVGFLRHFKSMHFHFIFGLCWGELTMVLCEIDIPFLIFS